VYGFRIDEPPGQPAPAPARRKEPWTVRASLRLPINSGATLAKVSGVVGILLQEKADDVRIDHLAATIGESHWVGGLSFTFRGLSVEDSGPRPDDASHVIRFAVARARPDDVHDWVDVAEMLRAVQFCARDAAGRAMEGRYVNSRRPGEIDYRVPFRQRWGISDEPASLSISVPTRVQPAEIPFEAHDLHLPANN
jgi:hypothetical protein